MLRSIERPNTPYVPLNEMQAAPRPIDVLIIHEHPIITAALRHILLFDPRINHVWAEGSGAEAISRIVDVTKSKENRMHPDVVLISDGLDLSAPTTADLIHETLKDVRVIAITKDDGDPRFMDAIAMKPSAITALDMNPEEVLDMVCRVGEGEKLLSTDRLVDLIVNTRAQLASTQALPETPTETPTKIELRAREMEVLNLMALEGLDDQEIADRLCVELSTARTHVRNIILKLEANSKLKAVAKARNLGLFTYDVNTPAETLLNPLTTREMEVLNLMALEGIDNYEIAERLQISWPTVRTHVQHIALKLQTNSRLATVAKAGRLGLFAYNQVNQD